MARRGTDLATQRPTAAFAFSDRLDGDLRVDAPPAALERRRCRLAPGEWTWLRQVHGDRVVVVERPGDMAGEAADAAVTIAAGAVLSVNTADCAGVVFVGRGPTTCAVGVAHAGWRGLELGVLQATVAKLRDLGAIEVTWRLGPCISPGAYEFGSEDLDRLVALLGPAVSAATSDGSPALDLRAGVRAALGGCDVDGVRVEERDAAAVRCTATDGRYYSWRARRDIGRQTAAVWMDVDG